MKPARAARELASPVTLIGPASKWHTHDQSMHVGTGHERSDHPHATALGGCTVQVQAPSACFISIDVKAPIARDEPIDVRGYRRFLGAVPQEITSDPFVVEPQWESCRKLGQHSAGHLIALRPVLGEPPVTPRR